MHAPCQPGATAPRAHNLLWSKAIRPAGARRQGSLAHVPLPSGGHHAHCWGRDSLRLGADEALLSDADAAEKMRAAVGGPVDVVFDVVGVIPNGSPDSLQTRRCYWWNMPFTHCFLAPIASRNLLLYQSLPTSMPYWPASARRQKMTRAWAQRYPLRPPTLALARWHISASVAASPFRGLCVTGRKAPNAPPGSHSGVRRRSASARRGAPSVMTTKRHWCRAWSRHVATRASQTWKCSVGSSASIARPSR